MFEITDTRISRGNEISHQSEFMVTMNNSSNDDYAQVLGLWQLISQASVKVVHTVNTLTMNKLSNVRYL